MRFVRQLVFEEPGRVAWHEAPDPERADPAGAIVRPLAVARCDLDLAMAAFGVFPGPFAVGHETVAEVVWAGEEVGSAAPGDRVVVPFQVSCGSCDTCRDGRFGGCETYRARAGAAFGFGESGGGHGGAVADLLAVPSADHMLVPAPAGVSDEILCTVPDNFIDAYRSVGPQLADRPGADVLVVGGAAPSIGLWAAGIALGLGAGSVRYVDDDPERLAAAAALGAVPEERPAEWPRRFERALITVDNTADAEGILTTIRSTEPYGFCTNVAIHFAPLTPLPLLEMYTRGITFHLSRADSRRFLPEVLELVASGTLDPGLVPTTTVPWERAGEAWLEPATKLVVLRGAS